MQDFTPLPALLGGALIGAAAALFLFAHGRVAGVSGLLGGALRGEERGPGAAFLVGLLAGGIALRFLYPSSLESAWTAPLPLALAGGLLVGLGTQLGSGCTSGHGVCGIGRLSLRSSVATGTFMATAFVTVFVVRHLLGGRS